jgi:3-oxoadipate enol-lactonase
VSDLPTPLDTGEADLPVLLCLHSLFLDPRMFDGLAEAAAGRFRVVRPTVRGQGAHALQVHSTVTMDECADDVIELVDSLGLAPTRVVAQSMGGDVAIRVAARRPDIVSAMALLGSSARSEPPENLEAFLPIADAVEASGFQGEVLDTTMAIMFGETSRADPSKADVVELWHERIASLPPQLCHAIRGVIEREDVTHLLPRIDLPVLVVSGSEDVARPPAWADQVVAGLPQASLLRLESVGHSPVLEAPDIVVDRVLDFLSR